MRSAVPAAIGAAVTGAFAPTGSGVAQAVGTFAGLTRRAIGDAHAEVATENEPPAKLAVDGQDRQHRAWPTICRRSACTIDDRMAAR
jgi:hypothetical protein